METVPMTVKTFVKYVMLSLTSLSCLVALHYSISIKEDIHSFDWFAYNKNVQDNSSSSESDMLKNITLNEFFSVVNVNSDNVFLILPLERKLLYRYLCSVESWALNHPNGSIWYAFTVNTLHDPDGIIKMLLAKYANINLIYVDLKTIFQGTPLYKINLSSAWKKSIWPGTHLSDSLRQALVWHKGGYYSDQDIYPVKSLIMLRNFMTVYRNKRAETSLMHFDVHHPWVNAFMEDMVKTFRPNNYGSLGPTVGVHTAKRLCNGPGGFLQIQANGSYRDCTIDGHTIRFLTYEHCLHLCKDSLLPRSLKDFEKFLQVSYAFHACDGGTRKMPADLRFKSFMQYMAERNCPLIQQFAKRHSNYW